MSAQNPSKPARQHRLPIQERPQRFDGVDKLRGLLITNMALGHAIAISLGSRSSELWFSHSSSLTDPTAFALRMLNHSATPFFFLIMGFSMALMHDARRQQGWTSRQVQGFFVTRGLLLIILQFSVVNLGWILAGDSFSWGDLSLIRLVKEGATLHYFGVLWALGVSMIATSLIGRFHSPVLLGIAVCVLAAPPIYLARCQYPDITGQIPAALAALAVPGRWPQSYILYTPIPWLAMTLFGLVLGRCFLANRERFADLLFPVGLVALLLFGCGIGVRTFLNPHSNLLEILYLQRYPPELLLLLYATGVNFLLLAFLHRLDLGVVDKILITFGRSALMLYVTHLFVFVLVITIVSPEPTHAQAAGLATLCLAIMFPACHLYLNHLKPMRRKLWQQIGKKSKITDRG